MTPNQNRTVVASLVLSASAFVGLVVNEGYTDTAVIPTRNDRPTVGFGSTFNENGTPVKLGDTTTPVRALIKAQAHINKAETLFRESLPGVTLYQGEYDLYLGWTYQYGINAWRTSSMSANLQAGEYVLACKSLLRYKLSGGFDCSTPGNKVCSGVWTRQLKRYDTCMAMQQQGVPA